jgi:gentisate 1,2-dioxygenase
MKATLDSKPGPWALEHYRDASGNYISSTMGAHAERLEASQQSAPRRDTCSYIYHVKSGSGKSNITKANGESDTVEWEVHDTFAVPAWSRIVHTANPGEGVYLFVLSDRPLLERLNMDFSP